MKVDVVRAGILSTVQDLGRTGSRHFGVSLGGSLDSHALRVANILVGNEENAAGIEVTLGGLHLRFADDRTLAWCGGEFDADFPAGHAIAMHADDELSFRPPKIGCRSWIAISGGIDVPVILGSRSTDLRGQFGGLGGRGLSNGDALSLGAATARETQKVSSWSAPVEWTQTAKAKPVLRVVRGVDWPRFKNATAMLSDEFEVTPDSNRMGVRLNGAPLTRKDDVDLVSEAVAPGTIQVPPNGQPIVLLGDCQTIGGYPKIAHVITVDLPLAAQLRGGDAVRFREVSIADAHQLLARRERDFACFKTGVSLLPR